MAAKVAEHVEKLPPVPELVLRLRATLSHPDATFADVVPLLDHDPGLSADLLKFANSARYGVAHRVDSLREAVLYVGMGHLAEFVSTTFLERTLMTTYSSTKGMHQYVDHSRAIADRTRDLVRRSGLAAAHQERASLIGLLHDIGRLVLMLAGSTHMWLAVNASPESMAKFVEHEQDLWGLDHCIVGATICRKWDFPDIFATAIEGHHGPWTGAQVCPEAAFVFLAHFKGIAGIDEAMARAMPEPVFRQLHLTPKDIAGS